MDKTWPEYVRRVADNLTQAQISARIEGVSTSNVGRWLRGEPTRPGAENVIAFARAFRRPPTEALEAAGYLNSGEVSQGRTPLDQFSTGELYQWCHCTHDLTLNGIDAGRAL